MCSQPRNKISRTSVSKHIRGGKREYISKGLEVQETPILDVHGALSRNKTLQGPNCKPKISSSAVVASPRLPLSQPEAQTLSYLSSHYDSGQWEAVQRTEVITSCRLNPKLIMY